MKINKLSILLFIIIIVLASYIIFDKFNKKENNTYENEIKIVDSITLPYVNIYLLGNGISYLQVKNYNEIDNLHLSKNLKDRLNTLYDRAFYYDIYIDGKKIKGYKIELDSEITNIKKIELDNVIYIIFIKDNNTIGLFNYDEYYNLLYTNVIDNYNNYKNISDVIDNKVIYLDGSSEYLKIYKDNSL